MPDVGRGTVPISPDFSGFAREVDRGVTPHIDKAGKEMEATFASSAKKSAASVDAAFGHVAAKAKSEFKGIPISTDAAKLDASVVTAAKKAAAKAADELSRIPGGVDAATFQAKVSAAASKAANEAATRLANIPAGIDSSRLQAEVSAAAAKAATPIPVSPDTSGFSRLPNEIRPHAKKAGDEMESTFAESAGKAATVVAGILGAKLTVDIGRRLLELGNQTVLFRQKTKTVFEDSADDVRSWAKENAASLGLTETHLAGVAAGFGDLLKPMGFTAEQAAEMSTETIGLAGALAAWSEEQDTAADVAKVLAKAMLGEREELKGLGISISEADVQARLLVKGQTDLTGTARQQAEAQATMALIFEKSTDAQRAWTDGSFDAIKKQNELRSKVSELVETMATGLLPVFEAAVAVLEKVPTPAITAAAGLVGIGAAALGVKKVVDLVKGLPNPLERSSLASGGLQGTLGRIGATAAGLSAAAVGVNLLADAHLRFEAGRGPDLAQLGNSLVRFAEDGQVAGELSREFGRDLGGLADKIGQLSKGALGKRFGEGGILGNVSGLFTGASASTKDAIRDVDALDKKLADLVARGERGLAESVLQRLAKDAGVAVPEVEQHLNDYKAALADVDTEQRLTGKSAGELGDATGALPGPISRAKAEMEKYADSINDAFGASQSLLGSQVSLEQAVDSLADSGAETAAKERELADAIRTHGRNSAEAKTAADALADARRRQVGDIDSLAQAQARLAEVQATAAGKVLTDADKYRIYRDKLIEVKDTLAPGSPLRQNLEGLINSLPPPEVKSQVIIDTKKAETALAGLETIINRTVTAGTGGQATVRTSVSRVMHSGGSIPGRSGADVPILAQAGEYVLQRSAVNAIGADTLASLNRYHAGGLVAAAMPSPAVAPLAVGMGAGVHIDKVEVNGTREVDPLDTLTMRLRTELYLAGA